LPKPVLPGKKKKKVLGKEALPNETSCLKYTNSITNIILLGQGSLVRVEGRSQRGVEQGREALLNIKFSNQK
jgi:hypothetical protein